MIKLDTGHYTDEQPALLQRSTWDTTLYRRHLAVMMCPSNRPWLALHPSTAKYRYLLTASLHQQGSVIKTKNIQILLQNGMSSSLTHAPRLINNHHRQWIINSNVHITKTPEKKKRPPEFFHLPPVAQQIEVTGVSENLHKSHSTRS